MRSISPGMSTKILKIEETFQGIVEKEGYVKDYEVTFKKKNGEP